MVRFSDKQWDRVRENYRKWWRGELGRPILPMLIYGADPGRPAPDTPPLMFGNCTNLSITPEQIIDRADYDLSCFEYHGDSYPLMHMSHFGPGVTAAFLGATPHSVNYTVWFSVEKPVPVSELHLEYDPDNIWLRRVKDIYRAGMKKWGGSVCMGMTDLGGVLDVLASFLTTEELLYSLNDEPGEVLRLVDELASLWYRFYDEINDILKGQQGYSDWSSIYAEQPSYMLQCDLSYMIGPQMFKKFVLGELAQTAGRMYKPFYHLDGVGQLIHIDALLSADEIKGIQWVPGDGEPVTRDWSALYAKISAAGKKIQAYYDLESYFDEILAVIKKPDDLVKMQFCYPINDKQNALRKLSRFCSE